MIGLEDEGQMSLWEVSFEKTGDGFRVEVTPQVQGAPPFGSGTALLIINAAPRVKVYTMLLSDKKAISVSRWDEGILVGSQVTVLEL